MKRVLFAVFAAAAVCVFAAPALGALCTRCKGKMYTADIGKCAACGGHTSSGAFKLCRTCSAKLGQCQHCRAPLGAKAKPPAPPARPGKDKIDPKKSAVYKSGRWEYRHTVRLAGTRSEGTWGALFHAGKELPQPKINDHYRTPWGLMYWVGMPKRLFGPHGWMPPPRHAGGKGKLLLLPLAAARAKQLNARADALIFSLRYFGEQGKPFYSLDLRVPVFKFLVPERRPPFWPAAQISKAQAKKIIGQFARDGLLAEMANVANKKIAQPKGPAYTLHITGLPGVELYADLGWGLPMLRRLEGIRPALDGPAAKTMDLLLGRLSGLKKKWEAGK